jgi:signal transduction histidine kinase
MARRSVRPHSRDRQALRQFTPYALSALGVAVAAWLELLILRSPAARLSLTPFGLAVASAVGLGGLGPGVLALLLSAVVIDFFVIDAGTFFSFATPADALVFSGFVAGWFLFCLAADHVYRQAHRDREERLTAERLASQSDRISQLTAALAQARTPAAVIEAAVQEPLHALAADAGTVLLVSRDGASADIARAVGYSGSQRPRHGSVVLDRKMPAVDAIGRGAPVVIESRSGQAAEYPDRMAGQEGEFDAMAAVPLLIGSRVAAVVQLEFRRARAFTAEDRDYLFTLATRAAQALDRTSEHEFALSARAEAESLRARADLELTERQKVEVALRASEARYRALAARTSRLHGLTGALSEAVTLNAVAQAVVHQGRIAVGATTGEVTLLVEGGSQFETLYSDAEGRATEHTARFPVESGLCATRAIETRHPVFVASFAEWQERYWRSASIAADGGYVSSATLPLLVEGMPIGVLAFHFTAPVNFDDEYRALLVSVAQHCAQALDRARLYEEAQRARADAETANRLKDEFVSIVSHELRTPLNAMLGWTAMLQKGTMEAEISARALQSIHDNATRQARLIDELLDFSRIVSGRLSLDLEDIDMRVLLRGVVESIIPSAAASGLELELAPMPGSTVRGDARRLEQVFFNLLGNALKFTPRGGRIAIDARPTGGMLEIRVSDTGVGIDPAFLPHVFDRFRQADTRAARTHGGLGLGLSIAKEVVEAHDGRISVESPGEGRGSVFVVTLPVTVDEQPDIQPDVTPPDSPPLPGNSTIH